MSNLSFISKLIERIVAKQFVKHLCNNNIKNKYQSAYKALHSTETALIKIQNDLLREVDVSGAAILVLLDLSAAFDTIDHTILLNVLGKMGVAGTAFD